MLQVSCGLLELMMHCTCKKLGPFANQAVQVPALRLLHGAWLHLNMHTLPAPQCSCDRPCAVL